MKTLFFILVFALTLISLSCKKSGTSTKTTVYTPTCSGAKSFKNDVLPVIQANCTSCHSNYSTYSQISSNASSIRASIADGSMPRNGTLSNVQKDAIMCWIDAGASNN